MAVTFVDAGALRCAAVKVEERGISRLNLWRVCKPRMQLNRRGASFPMRLEPQSGLISRGILFFSPSLLLIAVTGGQGLDAATVNQVCFVFVDISCSSLRFRLVGLRRRIRSSVFEFAIIRCSYVQRSTASNFRLTTNSTSTSSIKSREPNLVR